MNQNNKATVDHIVALSKGGSKFDKNNFVVCCNKCNSTKGNKDIETFKLELYEQAIK